MEERTKNTINFSSYTLNMKAVECDGIIVDGDAIIFRSQAGYACIVLTPDQMRDLYRKIVKEMLDKLFKHVIIDT